MLSLFGGPLTEADYQQLEARWLTRELADEARIRRVDSATGLQLMGKKKGDFSGLLIPYLHVGTNNVREYRLRRDNPEYEYNSAGKLKPVAKYVSPPGRGNMVYLPPGATRADLANENLPVVITEGEFKTLALHRLAFHESDDRRFLPVGLAGVWNWRGIIGKEAGPGGDRRDVKGVIPDMEKITWQGRRVVLAFDADAEEKQAVRIASYQLRAELTRRGAKVGILEWPAAEGKGVDDWLAHSGPSRVIAAYTAVNFEDWRNRLLRDEQARPLSCLDNAALYFEHDEAWRGVLGFNQFDNGYYVLKTPPDPVSSPAGTEIENDFDVQVARWLERRRILLPIAQVRRVVDSVARRNQFHPVKDYLNGLKWDGIERLESLFTLYAGAESNEYHRAVAKAFMVAAVARIMEPGCKQDSMLILEGPQGIGKSSMVRVLAGDEWFSDTLAPLHSKDALIGLRGVWLLEFKELDWLLKADSSTSKAFVDGRVDKFRIPYTQRDVKIPRQCVFFGSTNSEEYFKDFSGNRRYWPVRCGRILLEELGRDRDQLWAEAIHLYRQGHKWYLEGDLLHQAEEQQQERLDSDPWQTIIRQWAASPTQRQAVGDDHPVEPFTSTANNVSTVEVLIHAIGKPLDRITKADQMRVANCLKVSGYRRKKVWLGDGETEWRYAK